MVMNGNTPEERLKKAQRIVARYVLKDRDLVAELIAERRAEAAAESSDATGARADLGGVDDATTQSAPLMQTIKSKGGDG
jgi:hypothetical protein